MKKYILLLFLAFGSSFCMAQHMPNFNRNYDFIGGYYLRFHSIYPTDTGYYAIGTMADSIKGVWAGTFSFIELNGDVRWVRNYAAPDSGNIFGGDLVKSADNNFFIGGGYGETNILGDKFYNAIYKVSPMGDIIFRKHYENYNNPTNGLFTYYIFELPNGNILLKNNSPSELYLMYLDNNGDSINSQYFVRNTSAQEFYRGWGSILSINQDKHIIAGSKTVAGIFKHYFIVNDNLSMQNDSISFIDYNSRMGLLNTTNKTSHHTFFVNTQRSQRINETYYYPYIYGVDSNFNVTMNSTIRGDSPSSLYSAVRTFGNSDGSYTVLGTSILEQQNRDMGFIARVSESGQLLWQKGLYMPQHSHRMYNAAQTADGGYVVCGDILGPVTGYYQQGWLMKIDSFGCVLPNCHLATEEALETKQPAMLLYPNPATTHINVHIALPEGVEITPAYMDLIDNKGRVLETNKLPMQDMNYEFYLHNYVPGNYFIRIRQGNKQATKQFVKVRG